MRMVNTFMVRLFLITFLLVFFYGKSSSQSRGEEARFTDTLQICIADSAVAMNGNDARLEFTIYLKRTNANWNNGDSILGMSDLCFTYDPKSFVINELGNLTTNLIKANASLFVQGASGQDPECKMDIKVGTLAGLLHVGITPRNIDNPGVVYKRGLKLPKDSAVFICRIGVVLKTEGEAQPTHLGVQWDRPATGLMTVGGNPINEIIKGNVEVNPKPGLNVEFITETPLTVCEGDVAELVVRGESTGNALHYIWQDSKDNKAWHSIDTADGTKLGRTHAGHGYTYDLLGHGDTMRIYRTPGKIDSLYFRCIAEDLTVPLVGQKISTSLQLIVRDSIYGFLAQESDVLLPDQIDTVRKCPETESVAARFCMTGLTRNEFTALDSVFFDYYWEIDPGHSRRDTIGFKVAEAGRYPVTETIDGFPIYKWMVQLSKTGIYYLKNIWSKKTDYICSSGAPLAKYDTIYLKEDSNQILTSKTVLVNAKDVIIDSVDHREFTGNPDKITNNTNLGKLYYQAIGDWPSKYTALANPGTDTLHYIFTSGGVKTCSAIREIEIIDKKYLALKVLLEGPYKGKKDEKDNMPSLSKVFPTKAVTGSTKFVSPYDENCLIPQSTVNKFPGAELSDWIYIKLREVITVNGKQGAGDVAYTLSAFLRQDGMICDTSGVPYLPITRKSATDVTGKAYFVVVEHRNHLAIMSAKPIRLSTKTMTAISAGGDFTVLANVYDNRPGIGNPPLLSALGQNCMILGDVNGDGLVTGKDIITTIKENGARGYKKGDVTFDQLVTGRDILLFRSHNGNVIKFN